MSILPQLFKGEGYCRGFIYAIVPDNVGVESGLNYIDYLRGNATDELVFKRLSQRYRSCSGRVFTACYISYKTLSVKLRRVTFYEFNEGNPSPQRLFSRWPLQRKKTLWQRTIAINFTIT